jgi:hypothetical protein
MHVKFKFVPDSKHEYSVLDKHQSVNVIKGNNRCLGVFWVSQN